MHACCVVCDELSIQNSQNVEFPSLSPIFCRLTPPVLQVIDAMLDQVSIYIYYFVVHKKLKKPKEKKFKLISSNFRYLGIKLHLC